MQTRDRRLRDDSTRCAVHVIRQLPVCASSTPLMQATTTGLLADLELAA
jgi:hypothetical protein